MLPKFTTGTSVSGRDDGGDAVLGDLQPLDVDGDPDPVTHADGVAGRAVEALDLHSPQDRRSGSRWRGPPADEVEHAGAAVLADATAAEVGVDGGAGVAVERDAPLLEVDAPPAERLDRRHVVADEQHRAALLRSRPRPSCPGTFAGRRRRPTASTSSTMRISGFEVRGDGEREPHVHAAAVALDRRVEELLDLGELDDRVELAVDRPCASSRGSAPFR